MERLGGLIEQPDLHLELVLHHFSFAPCNYGIAVDSLGEAVLHIADFRVNISKAISLCCWGFNVCLLCLCIDGVVML